MALIVWILCVEQFSCVESYLNFTICCAAMSVKKLALEDILSYSTPGFARGVMDHESARRAAGFNQWFRDRGSRRSRG